MVIFVSPHVISPHESPDRSSIADRIMCTESLRLDSFQRGGNDVAIYVEVENELDKTKVGLDIRISAPEPMLDCTGQRR